MPSSIQMAGRGARVKVRARVRARASGSPQSAETRPRAPARGNNVLNGRAAAQPKVGGGRVAGASWRPPPPGPLKVKGSHVFHEYMRHASVNAIRGDQNAPARTTEYVDEEDDRDDDMTPGRIGQREPTPWQRYDTIYDTIRYDHDSQPDCVTQTFVRAHSLCAICATTLPQGSGCPLHCEESGYSTYLLRDRLTPHIPSMFDCVHSYGPCLCTTQEIHTRIKSKRKNDSVGL